MTSLSVPKQSGSHAGLLHDSHSGPAGARFDAIVVPTYRPAARLRSSIRLARETRTPLIVACSQAVRREEAIEMAARANVKAFAFDLPPGYALPRDDKTLDFETSRDDELSAASPDWNKDLSMKRNIGLVLARLLGWTRLMFLDDDIYSVGRRHVTKLATALDDHSVSALIPKRYPDNSVVCHAHRLGGGKQDVFASASGIGVRCDRDDLAFFPNLYNEDWFFFASEAARRRIARVGESRQRKYDPYRDPDRAVWEEFGDLLAEGLYARLDIREGIWDVDAGYWEDFKKRRTDFHQQVTEALGQVGWPRKGQAAKASQSVRAAQDQLLKITPRLCQKFIDLWREDLANWRDYLASLPPQDSLTSAFEYLKIDPAVTPGFSGPWHGVR